MGERTNKRVTALVIREKKILLIHRFKKGAEYWVVPGGGVEVGETLIQALEREVLEETSLSLLDFKYLGNDQDAGLDIHFYNCKLAEGVAEIIGPEKDDFASDNIYLLEWVDVELLPKLKLFPVMTTRFLTEL